MRPTEESFEKWNEEHAKKHDLDKFYNHPNFIFRYIEIKRIKDTYKTCRNTGYRQSNRSWLRCGAYPGKST